MSVPQSTIYICKSIPLNNKYEHTYWFPDAETQFNFFVDRAALRQSGYTYLRRTWSIKIGADMETASAWSYLFFQNSTLGKVYYYFINSIEYINENTVELFLELDVMQTYLFDWNLLPSFVERCHVENDAIGAHTVDEGLELGEFIINDIRYTSILDDLCLMILATENPNVQSIENRSRCFGTYIGNSFVGMGLYAVQKSDFPHFAEQLLTLSDLGLIDCIVTMWLYPKHLIQLMEGQSWSGGSFAKQVQENEEIKFALDNLNATGSLDGYTPRNAKLYTYPFNFMYVSNGNGAAATFRFERFEDSNPNFRLQGSASPEGGVRLIPEKYNQSENAYIYPNTDEGLTIDGYPTCVWNADAYKIWLAQNQNQHAMSMATGQLQIAAGAAGVVGSAMMLNAEGAVQGMQTAINGALQIANIVAQKKDAAIQPPQARGSFSSNINVAHNNQHFSFYRKSVCAEMAEIIDKYFDMYGYKISRYMTPNIRTRTNHTYIKTIGCQLNGEFCNEDRVKICNNFDRGITFWCYDKSFCDYSANNPPLPPDYN